MTELMADRIRLIIDTEDLVRRAVHLRRIKMGGSITVSDVVNGILREALAQEINEVSSYPTSDTDDAPPPAPAAKRKKGGGK